MAVNLELGVDLGSFNQGINQAKAQISAFNATLKFAESSFKATGDAEAAMTSKTTALNGKLQAQKSMIQQYAKALEEMRKNGVDQTSEAYLKMQKNMILAQASMNDTQAALNGLNSSQQDAAQSADKLTQSVQGISKKVSLEQVIGGIDRITDGMERAAQKVAEFGKQLWDTIMDSARRADDTATLAEMYGIDLQTFKQMQALVANGMDTSVEAILSAQKKLTKGIGAENTAALKALKDLNVSTKTLADTGNGVLEFVDKDPAQVFWDIGRALMNMNDAYDKEAAAQALLGRSWQELVPLFNSFKSLEDYQKALSTVDVTTEQATLNSAELADKVATLENTWKTLKDEIIGAVAPGLTAGAEALDSVLSTVLEYLQKPEGQEMLTKLGESVAGLFDDLTKVNPEDVVNNFVTVFDKLKDGLEFISNNWSGIVDGIKAIGAAFGLMKVGEGVLEVVRLFSGFAGLRGKIGGSGATSALSGAATTSLTGILKTAIGGALSSLGTLALGTLAITAGAVILGGSFNAQKVLDDAAQTGSEQNAELDQFNETVAAVSTNEELKAAHEVLAGYVVPRGQAGMSDLVDLQEFARRYIAATRDGVVDPLMDAVSDIVFDKGQEYFENFQSAMETVLENNNDYTGESQQAVIDMVTDLMNAVRQQMASEVLMVRIEPDLTGVQAALSAVTFTANAALNLGGGGMSGAMAAMFGHSFANGIPYMPYDGLAMLHKGERVVPAREVNNRSFSSNLYVESMIMNNGTDANGLASAMAAAQRRTMSGYGS